MKIFSVKIVGYDGVEYMKLFKSKASAKVHAREKNREIGLKDWYRVYEEEVNE